MDVPVFSDQDDHFNVRVRLDMHLDAFRATNVRLVERAGIGGRDLSEYVG